MIIFATSDKGGTGRSVTTSNILYRMALQGLNVCYADFDFGSPTAGAIFEVEKLSRGTTSNRGLHSYFEGGVAEPESCNIWKASDCKALRTRPAGAGSMVLVPGDAGGAEFTVDAAMTDRCLRLLRRLEEEYDVSFVDLSAGRSYALRMALEVTAGPRAVPGRVRWLVFHRWTMQHITAANGLVYGDRGLLDTGVKVGHDRDRLLDRIRFVRTAVIDPDAPDLSGLRPAQVVWLNERDEELDTLASQLRLGHSMLLGSVPLDPMLQWHEQLLTAGDQHDDVANAETIKAFGDLAELVQDDRAWERW